MDIWGQSHSTFVVFVIATGIFDLCTRKNLIKLNARRIVWRPITRFIFFSLSLSFLFFYFVFFLRLSPTIFATSAMFQFYNWKSLFFFFFIVAAVVVVALHLLLLLKHFVFHMFSLALNAHSLFGLNENFIQIQHKADWFYAFFVSHFPHIFPIFALFFPICMQLSKFNCFLYSGTQRKHVRTCWPHKTY